MSTPRHTLQQACYTCCAIHRMLTACVPEVGSKSPELLLRGSVLGDRPVLHNRHFLGVYAEPLGTHNVAPESAVQAGQFMLL